jgi:outer membrane receptor for ferrienterochelin and colicin
VDWDEQIFRAYLFWTPHKWLALNAEYIYEDLDRDKNFNFNVKTLETHYLPLGINFFHPSGLSASLKGTYVDQEGSFNRLDAPLGETEHGEDDFWLFDAAISYRFPKRYGFLTVGVSNLTDKDFEYFDTDINNPRFQPDRVFFGKVTLALP